MANALEFCLDVGRGDHIAVGKVAEVQLHAGLEAPVQRHGVDGHRLALAAGQRRVHGAVEVVGRIQVGAVVGGQLHQLHRPAFAIGQVFLAQAADGGHMVGRAIAHQRLERVKA